MKKNPRIKNGIPLGICATVALVSCGRTAENEKELPNIVYILADDLGYGDLTCYGQQRFSTPNIDRLAREGMLFTQHYTGCTVSAPSRSCLMTGLHTGHTPIRGNKEMQPEGQWPLPAGSVTVAEMLKTRGYSTGAFGKWGLGFIDTEGDPNAQGFDEFAGYNCQRLAHNYYPDHLWHNHKKIILHENDSGRTGAYSADIIHKAALDFIENHQDKPFFMFYPTTIPHAELIAKEEYLALFRGKFDPEKPYSGVEIIDLLIDLGIEENTIVIFASDNGPHLEGGADPVYFNSSSVLRGFKRDLYEGGIRTPMIVKWPLKVKAGTISGHISAFWDVLPTFADIAGSEVPENIDGISFLPELLGKKQKQHEYLYWEFHEQGGRQAVRMSRWKAVRLNVNKDHNEPGTYTIRSVPVFI